MLWMLQKSIHKLMVEAILKTLRNNFFVKAVYSIELLMKLVKSCISFPHFISLNFISLNSKMPFRQMKFEHLEMGERVIQTR
jgi:hypothetical protein